MLRCTPLFAAFCALLASGPARSQPPALTLRSVTAGEPRSVVMNQEFVFVATSAGVQTLDVVEEGRPQAAFLPIHEAIGLRLDGDFLYVLADTLPRTLHIVDVSNAPSLTIRSSLVLPPGIGTALTPSFDVENGLALFGFNDEGAHLVDVSDPDHPALLPSIFLPAPARIGAVALVGHTGVIMESYQRMAHTVDLSEPLSPQFMGSVQVGVAPIKRTVSENGLVFALNDQFAYIIDPSDPAAPTVMSSVPSGSQDLAVREGQLHLAHFRVRTYDISDPVNPVLIDTFDQELSTSIPYRIAADGGKIAYLTNQNDTILDGRPDAGPQPISNRLRVGRVYSIGHDAGRIVLRTNQRVAQYNDARRLDFPTAHSPVTLFNAPNTSHPELMSVFERQAVMADRNLLDGYRLEQHIFAPVAIGHRVFDNSVWLRKAIYNGKAAFTAFADAAHANELHAYSAAILSQNFPLLDTVTLPAPVLDFELADPTLCVLTNDGAIHMVDATDASDLQPRGALPNTDLAAAFPVALARVGASAYVLDKLARITTIDLSNPDAPARLGAGDVSGVEGFAGPDIEVRDGVAYFTAAALDGRAAFYAVDVRDPHAPALLASHPLPRAFVHTIALLPDSVIVGADGMFQFELLEQPCPADVDGDGAIGHSDLGAVLGALHTTPAARAAPDVDGDGDVDFADLHAVIAAFNSSCN